MMIQINFTLLQAAETGSVWSQYSGIIFVVAMFLVMYFFFMRPQAKKAKDQRTFLSEIKAGDKVVTIGGVHGKIAKVDEDSYLLEIDTNTRVRIEKSVISLDFTKAMLARK